MSLLVLLLCWVGLLSPAHAQEYRRIKLASGRVLVARVDSSAGGGLTLALAQGQVRVPFTDVLEIEPVDEATFKAEPPWQVAVLPFSGADPQETAPYAAAVREALAFLPAVRVLEPGEALAACGADLDCALPLAASAGFTAVVAGELVPPSQAGVSPRVSLTGAFTSAPTARGHGEALLAEPRPQDPRELVVASALSLNLVPTDATLAALPVRPPTPAPLEVPPATRPAETTTPDRARLRALAWVPLPGAPSIARRDWTGLAASWALAVPGSAALVYGTGASATSRGQFLTLSALSCYTMTVASNLLFGTRVAGPGAPGQVGLVVAPAPEGAALMLSVTGR